MRKIGFWGTLGIITASLVLVGVAVTVSLRTSAPERTDSAPAKTGESSAMMLVAEQVEDTIALCEERARDADITEKGFAETRPRLGFGNQVLSPEDIRIGDTYVKCDLEKGRTVVYTVISEPYTGQPDSGSAILVVDVLHWCAGSAYAERLYLADAGVIPYREGWNPANILLHPMSPR